MTVKLKVSVGASLFPGDQARFSPEYEQHLIDTGAAERVGENRPMKKSGDLKDAPQAAEKAKKAVLAAEIKRLGGVPPHHASSLDKFEEMLNDLRNPPRSGKSGDFGEV